MTTLYFIRHAQSDASVKDDFVRPLTETGRQSAKVLADQLRDTEFQAFYASPYPRTQETLRPLAESQDKKIIPIFDLRERTLGLVTPEAAQEHRQKQWADEHYKAQEGESLYEVQQRNLKAIRSILRMHQNQVVAVGTHGFALSAILKAFLPFSYENHLELIAKSPCVYRLQFSGEDFISAQEIQPV